MTIEIGFQGSSKTNASVVYFDVSIPTDGSTKTVHNLHATNNGKAVTIPSDFAVTEVQLANVPNGIDVNVHFESENVTLTDSETQANLPGPGLALGNATVSATIKK